MTARTAAKRDEASPDDTPAPDKTDAPKVFFLNGEPFH